MRRLVVLAIFMSMTVFGATAAYAGWAPASSGSGLSSGRSVGLPTSAAATGTGATTVAISWAAPGRRQCDSDELHRAAYGTDDRHRVLGWRGSLLL